MQFPVYIPIGPWSLHAHWVFESLAYLLGFRLHLLLRRRAGDALDDTQRLWMVAAAAAGAAVGSKVLYWLGDPRLTLQHWHDPYYLMAGKTIVGGVIGGLIAVEWAKGRLGITRSTGDLFAVPLAVGIAIGRVGCFLSGLGDHTAGNPTSLPWGVDFGDGLARHPTQVYETLWLVLLTVWLVRATRTPHREGDVFRLFMVGYLGFRLGMEFLKPGVFLGGLTAIQWACAGMLVYYGRDLPFLFGLKEAGSHG